MVTIPRPHFLDYAKAKDLADQYGSPIYVYDQAILESNAAAVLAFPNAFGCTVRYAMKAASNAAILKLVHRAGLHIDASSGYEVHRAMAAGIPPENISLSAQELPSDLGDLLEAGIRFNACSPTQLERFGQLSPNEAVGLRLNPGTGSGGNNRTNVGGPSSSFGIWYEWVPRVKELLLKYKLSAIRVHTHIGSGSDPKVWLKVAGMNFDLVRRFPEVTTLNLGGGYKVGRMPGEQTTDLQMIGRPVKETFEKFEAETGRRIHLEIEPGTFLVANACALLSRVQDLVSTGAGGYNFIKLNTGMTELLRPSIYGAQHPISLLSDRENDGDVQPYVVVGHCCESGDILTPAPGDPEVLLPRLLPEAEIGDFCIIDGVGAYASSMTSKHYNSYPEVAEVLLDKNQSHRLIRRRQQLEDIWANEV